MVSTEMDSIVWIVMTILAGCEASTTPASHPSLSKIRLENGGLCDTKEVYHPNVMETKCISVVVHGHNFINSKDLSCHFSSLSEKCVNPSEGCSVFNFEHRDYYSVTHRRAKFINSTTIICSLYDVLPVNITVNYERYDLEATDPTALYIPYSSLCLDCSAVNGTCASTINQMRKYCRINSRCMEEDVFHPEYQCNICRTADNGTKVWHPIISVKCGFAVLPVWSIVLLVIVAIAMMVITVFLVRTCYSEFRPSQSAPTCDNVEENATEPAAQSSDDTRALVAESPNENDET